MHKYFVLTIICLTAVVLEPVYATPLLIENEHDRINLTHSTQVLEDPTGSLTIEDVTQSEWSGQFYNRADSSNNFGVTRAAIWLKLDLNFRIPYSGGYLLEVPYPPLDELTAYFPDGAGGFRVIKTGDTKPFQERDIDNHDFLFRLPPNLHGQAQIYLRVFNRGPVVAPIYLWKEQAFFQNEQLELLVAGTYFGALIALTIFNLFIYFSVRDTSYLWYVSYLCGMGMFLFIYKGLAFRFFWPDSPDWGNHALYLFLTLAMFSGLRFSRTMLNLQTFAPKLNKVIYWTAWGFVLYPVFGLIWSKYFLIGALPYLALITLILVVSAITLSILGGYKPARFVALSFLTLLPGALLISLRTLGVVPDNILISNSLIFGVVSEALLLSFALAYRIRLLNAEIEQSHQSMVKTKKHFTKEIIGARDSELRRIASELHDGIGQNLLVVSNRLGSLKKQMGDSIPQNKIVFLQEIVQETIRDIRRMSHRLHPHQLERLGLKAALKETIKRSFEDTEIQVEFQVDDFKDSLDPAIELHIYRIVQEAIKNIVTHSNASWANIEIKDYLSNISIWIEDNGDNIDKNTYIQNKDVSSFGLTSIKERVKLLHGTLEFKSTEKAGFLFLVTLPIQRREIDG